MIKYNHLLRIRRETRIQWRQCPADQQPVVKSLMIRFVDTLQNTIGIIDFWKKPIEVKQLRGTSTPKSLLAGIPQLADRHERIAVEIGKLTEKEAGGTDPMKRNAGIAHDVHRSRLKTADIVIERDRPCRR